jgi:Gpi18-like mannosyltransferase
MKHNSNSRTIIFMWLGWAIVLIAFQAFIRARFDLKRPDYALFWTPYETRATSQDDKPYLIEPFLNQHVSWDSEYYLSTAIAGYDDPQMRAIPPDYNWNYPQVALKSEQPDWVSMNYAFFPLYPFAMRILSYPLHVFRLNPIATATLAGVIVSMLGTLGAMLALADIGRDALEESGGTRAAFYLIIFPAGMFLAQVYTEGLFLGLSFGALALARRQKWVWAAILAAGATWTRAAGALLLLPMGLFWLEQGNLKALFAEFSWSKLGKLLLVASPALAYLIWNAIFGEPFHLIESNFFSRGLLLIKQSMDAWTQAWDSMFSDNLQARAYYMVEFTAILFGFLACGLAWKRYRTLSIYGLVTIFFSLTSGGAQGMHRYVMAAPVVFLVLADWGRNKAFDRIWTIISVLLMGIFVTMFSFDFWAG